MQRGSDDWSERFRRFAEQECRGLSPLYEAIALKLADDVELLEWLAAVIGPRAHPTLAFAAVHYLLLRGADGAGLEAFYPTLTDAPEPPERAYDAFRAFCVRERDQLAPLLATRLTQTNEVGRCSYLLPAFVLAAKRTAKPLWIIDVGCSAGLNLLFDRYCYDYGNGQRAGDRLSAVKLRPQLRGKRIVTAPMPTIAGRVGVDLEPIDPHDDDAIRWLEACVWPEHLERFRNVRAAFDIARRNAPRLVKGNAVDLLPHLAAEADADAALVVVNTNVMLYFSRDERVRYGELLADLGASRELVWIANEHPAVLASAGFGAHVEATTEHASLPLVMSHFAGAQRDDHVLALIGPHGRWLEWY